MIIALCIGAILVAAWVAHRLVQRLNRPWDGGGHGT